MNCYQGQSSWGLTIVCRRPADVYDLMIVRIGAIHAHTLVVNMIMAKRKDFGRGEFYLIKFSKLFFLSVIKLSSLPFIQHLAEVANFIAKGIAQKLKKQTTSHCTRTLVI